MSRDDRWDHEKLLSAWSTERKQQLERSLAATVHNGRLVTERNVVKALIRDWVLWAIQLVPSWKREIEKGPRADGMTKYHYQPGLAFLPGGGLSLPQAYAFNLLDGTILFSDDMIFAPWKTGLFQLLILVDGASEVEGALKEVKNVTSLSDGLILENETTVIIQDTTAELKTTIDHRCIARLATGDEFAADMTLCKNRPAPKYYDAFRMKKEVDGKKFIVVRPDRFVYARCSNREELQDALKMLPEALHRRKDSS